MSTSILRPTTPAALSPRLSHCTRQHSVATRSPKSLRKRDLTEGPATHDRPGQTPAGPPISRAKSHHWSRPNLRSGVHSQTQLKVKGEFSFFILALLCSSFWLVPGVRSAKAQVSWGVLGPPQPVQLPFMHRACQSSSLFALDLEHPRVLVRPRRVRSCVLPASRKVCVWGGVV